MFAFPVLYSYNVAIWYNDGSTRVVATYKYRRDAIKFAEKICNGNGDAIDYRLEKIRRED